MADGGNVYKDKFITFLFTSVLAGLVTTSFTYKSWREQTRLDLAKRRLDEATKSFERASILMSTRIFHSYRLANGADGDEDAAFNTKLEKYDKAVEDWNVAYPDLLQDFQFALEIDDNGRLLPFHEIDTNDFDKKLRCHFAFEHGNGPQQTDWRSPTWRLAALHHCFIVAKVKSRALSLRQKPEPAPPPTRGVLKARDKSEPAPAPESAEARRVKFEALDSDIDDLMTHAEEVRVAGKKAVARLREGAETRGFLEFLKSW
jgi:hypothetical protein